MIMNTFTLIFVLEQTKKKKIIDTPVKPQFYYMKGGLNYTDVLPLCMATV